ncbi:MAG: aminopeptidase [Defluviitaleaceae bacterium]|nr:aminopeptidase [Defluviitaleaceae bacterium]
MDQRNNTLAKNLINYSVRLKKGEKILIESIGYEPEELINEIVKEAYAVGAFPYVNVIMPSIQREILINSTKEQFEIKAKLDKEFIDNMDAYIAVRSGNNIFELSDVPTEKINDYSKVMKEVTNTRLRKKWVVLRYPTPSMAQSAKKPTAPFKDFYYNVCCLDYGKMDKAQEALKNIMEKTDKVHIKGVGTDISFSIKDMPIIKCSGEFNIPDGEVFTAPVKDSVNGYITYNIPSLHNGFSFENVKLEFENGKIVKSTANDTERITKIFNQDEGARYIGEFAIGVNPYITEPMYDILFDEKIAGSFHFTPGNSYENAFNGNTSSLHWDLIVIQTPEYGGGEIYFDDVLIRKDGRFVLKELEVLNPENLM